MNISNIKGPVTAVFLLASLLGSCTSKVTELTPAQQKARIDSLVRVREQEIKEFEQDRLLDRMSIEVKEKADSILAERRKNIPSPQPVTAPDTTVPVPAAITPTPDTSTL